ncbi:MAG: TonB-dependent receptor, partial [Rhodospirillaceae bacterium]
QYYHDTFGDQTTYRTTASYKLVDTGTRFHASYSTGFKAPTLVQVYYNNNAGNAALMPEESQGYDVGVEQTLLNDRMHFDVTFFNNRMTNQIERDSSVTPSVYRNVQSARHMGFESSAGVEATDELNLTLTHTYMQSRNNATGLAMEYQPHHVASLRVTYDPRAVPGLSTWTRGTVATGSYDTSEPSGTSPRHRIGGYTTWDLGADYKIDDSFTVYGRVENLFDKNYGQYYNANNAGVAAYTGLRMKF